MDRLSPTISSLQAHGRKINAHANNIANVNTNGFKRERAVLQEGRLGEVRVQLSRDRSPAPQDPLAPDAPGVEKELANVDLAHEMTGLIPSEIGYKANLQTIRAQDELIGTLLDTLA